MLYASGGQGSMRYFFLHGNHEAVPLSGRLVVTAEIIVFDRLGKMQVSQIADLGKILIKKTAYIAAPRLSRNVLISMVSILPIMINLNHQFPQVNSR